MTEIIALGRVSKATRTIWVDYLEPDVDQYVGVLSNGAPAFCVNKPDPEERVVGTNEKIPCNQQ